GCVWIACAALAAARLSSPGLRPFLASQQSLAAAILRCAPAGRRVRRRSPSACRSPSRPRWSRARTAKEKLHGKYRHLQEVRPRVPGRDRNPELAEQGRPHRPETNRTSDNAPSHRVYVGRAEIGAAWSKRSNDGRDYVSGKLDDPSFTAPIYANLVEDGETFALIWSRSRKTNGD